MRKLKKHKSHKWKFLLLGLFCGMLLTSGAGLLVYQSVTGKNVLSKVHYLLDRGKGHVISFGKEKMKSISKTVQKQPEDTNSNILHLNINVEKIIRRINPMIYGSNLSSKAEFEMDVAKLAKELGITNFRFPGGNSLGYRWKKSVYDFDSRFDEAPLSNIENVIKFCNIAGAETVVQVNLESGTAQEAAEWVKYMNKGPGARVNYWELGNEVYGDWDKGYMTGEEYVKVIREYSSLMRQVDPTIKIGANWGGVKYQEFDKAVAQGAFSDIDFVSFHWYPSHINKQHPYKGRIHPLPKEVMANSLAVQSLVERFEQMVDQYAPHRKGKIEFTVMEWDGSWDGVPSDVDFEYKGMMWSLANAIFYANTLGEFAKHGITVANQFTHQEIMFGFIRGWDADAGWGGSRWDGKTIRPKALAFKLFARYFGDILVEHTLTGSSSYYKEADWRADSFIGDVPYVTGYASVSSKENYLAVALINKHAEKDFTVNITVNGDIALNDKGEVWILNGPDLKAQNDGSPGRVNIKKFDLSGIKNKFSYTVQAHSVNLLRIPAHYKKKGSYNDNTK